MSNRGIIRNPDSQDSLSRGSQGSRHRHTSHGSIPISRVGGKRASHESTPIRLGGGKRTSHDISRLGGDLLDHTGGFSDLLHDSTLPRHAHHRPVSRESTPISGGSGKRASHDISRLGGDRGGLCDLLHQQMVPEHNSFSDEDSDSDSGSDEGGREDTPHDSNSGDVPAFGTSQRPFISCLGKKFGNSDVHREVRKILEPCINRPWISYKLIPESVIEQVWERFKTLYVWDLTQDARVKETFKNVMKGRYSDIMNQYRTDSAKLARAAGQVIHPDNAFDIMKNFPPRKVQAQLWIDLCTKWNTDAWKRTSVSNTINRKSTDSGGKISIHTWGSIGYDEHRIRLTAKLCRPPSFLELFLYTHLDKDSKKRYFAGDREGMEFCTNRAREADEAYSQAMIEKYGDNVREHPIDDPDLWASTQTQIHGDGGLRKRPIFGIGSSDIEFVVTGKSSAGCSSTSWGSQSEVLELRTKLETVERERERERREQENERRERENERALMDERQKKMEEQQQKMGEQMAQLMKYMSNNSSQHGNDSQNIDHSQ